VRRVSGSHHGALAARTGTAGRTGSRLRGGQAVRIGACPAGSGRRSAPCAGEDGAWGPEVDVADSGREVNQRVTARCRQAGGGHHGFGGLLDDAGGQWPLLVLDGGLEQDSEATGAGAPSAGEPDVPVGRLDRIAGPHHQVVGRRTAASGAPVAAVAGLVRLQPWTSTPTRWRGSPGT
jgi:hypothetical protein